MVDIVYFNLFLSSIVFAPEYVHLKGFSGWTNMLTNVTGESRSLDMLAFNVLTYRC